MGMRYLTRLRELSPPELDAAARDSSFLRVFKKLGKGEQVRLLLLFARERVAELSVASKIALLKMLQSGRTRRHHEMAVRDLILSTHGAELTRLKRALDKAADHRNLHQLIYHDLDLDEVRQAILNHFLVEAEEHPSQELKIISDVDDTFYRNWVDPRYPARTVYPGVVQLFRELDGVELGDLVFLTGRPGHRSGYLEKYYRRRLGALGAEEITLLTGSFLHQFVRPWIFTRKWLNLERYRSFFPEMGFVMFGDSGQADPEFLTQALQRYPGQVRAALLHMVIPLSLDRLKRCNDAGIVFFDTYVGAAVHLHERGLLTTEAVDRVAAAARANLAAVDFRDPPMRKAREDELARDLAAVQGLSSAS